MFNNTQFRNELEHLVNIDSGSFCTDGVRLVNKWFAERFEKAGWDIKWFEHEKGPKSNSFLAYKGNDAEFNLLVLCHTDTVFPEGEVAKRPFKLSDDGERYTGPGVADMKSGCLFALYSAEELIKDPKFGGKVAYFFNGQHEEGGSIGTKEIIELYSSRSKFVIATEPARPSGMCLKQRKGISRYTLTFKGKSAHAGVNPEDGECAITEMAHWIIYLSSLTDYSKGITVNCGVVKGGTVPNAVADFAELKIDVRVVVYEDAKRIEKLIFDKLDNKINQKVDVEIAGRITRPPLMPCLESEKVAATITEMGKKYGLDIKWTSSGGGSDASFSSGMGIPSLDGIAAVGGGFHTEREYLETKDIDKRYYLFNDTIKLLK